MSIGKRRNSGIEPRQIGSKIRPTQRRPIKAATRLVRVNAAELARRNFLHLAVGAAALPAMSRTTEAQTPLLLNGSARRTIDAEPSFGRATTCSRGRRHRRQHRPMRKSSPSLASPSCDIIL